VSGQVSGDNSVPWYNPKIAEKELDVKVYVQVGKQQKLPTNLQLYTCLIQTLDS